MERWQGLLRDAWGELPGGGDPGPAPALSGPGPWLASPYAVDALAVASIAAALLAAGECAQARGAPRPTASLDGEHAACAFRSERFTRVAGRPAPSPFHPLSAFLPAADGWVRLHANYPHHRRALLRALELAPDAPSEAVAAAVARRSAIAVEDAIVDAGGCAAAVRTEAQWLAHPQGAALAELGLLDVRRGAGAATALAPGASPARPAAGMRVLDCTRVIAGPIATRMLAALGADVLRLDSPALPELEDQQIDTGPGKRSAVLDLRTPAGRARMDALLGEADVLITGYRPGALAALGLEPAALAERFPSLSTITLSAWGEVGPWARRRGFDSLVQAACGIAVACAPAGERRPGALPAQALDHATGYLIAACALRSLALRARERCATHSRFALARTARWLARAPRGDGAPPPAEPRPQRWATTLPSPYGEVTTIAPPGRLDGRALAWTHGPVPIGTDPPSWAR